MTEHNTLTLAGYQLRLIDRPDEWASLAEPWRELQARDSRASVFQTYTWLSQLWKLDEGPTTGLRIAAVHQPDGRLAALAPMVIHRSLGPLGVRIMRFVGQGQSDYQDILLADDCDQDAALGVLGQWLRVARCTCDLIDTGNLAEGSHLLEHRAGLLPRDAGWSTACRESDAVRWVPGGGGFAGFEAQMGKRTRKNLRNQWRRVVELDGADITTLTESRGADQALRDLVALHQARQNSRGQRGLFRSPQRVRVLTGLFHAMLDRGMLRLTTLYVRGRCQAALAVLHFNGVSTAYTIGWREDPELARYSLGRLFLYMAAEQALGTYAAREFNLGAGDEGYKASFTKHIRPLYRLTYRCNNLRCRLYDLEQRGLDYAYHAPWVQRMYFTLRPRTMRPGP